MNTRTGFSFVIALATLICSVLATSSFEEIFAQTNDATVTADVDSATRHLILVQGVDGQPKLGKMFDEWVGNWTRAAKAAGMPTTLIDGSSRSLSDFELLKKTLEEAVDIGELWIVLIGHGTFDGNTARFNLVGDDASAVQINSWLADRKGRTVFVNCASCSAPFVDVLKGPNRVIISATKSGHEMSFTYFGRYLSETIGDQAIDLDKDERTSLLEAAIAATGKTAEFYAAESRLVSEHALIEDNSDGRGTPVDWFRGTRVSRKAKDGTPSDGVVANQIFFLEPDEGIRLSPEQSTLRDTLESRIESLRANRDQHSEQQYYQRLESIMVQLARLYEAGQPTNLESEK